jgi:hypothetical protein
MSDAPKPRSERVAADGEAPQTVCSLCGGEGWRRAWVVPTFVAFIGLALTAVGIWLGCFGVTAPRRGDRVVTALALVAFYIAALAFIAAWKGRWRLCRCELGRRGWLYDG